MEKAIYTVEISHLSDDFFLYNKEKEDFLIEHIYDDILSIKDKFYTIYFILNKNKNIISIYLVKYYNNIDKISLSNEKTYNFIENKEEKSIVKYQLSKKDFKDFVINNNLSNYKDELPEFIFHHFLNYDHNLWNDVNDWLNSNLNYKYFKYNLIFIKIGTLFPFSK